MNWRTLPVLLRRLNWGLLLIVLLLLVLGVLFVYSADSRSGNPALGNLCYKQMAWMAIGLVCFFCMAFTDYHYWIRWSGLIYLLALCVLLLVFVPHVGVKLFGARRWIQLPGFGVFQPSELMKLAVLLVLARIFGWPGATRRHARGLIIGIVALLAPLLLIIKQPDLGTAMVFPVLLAVLMFAAGWPARVIGGMGLAAVLAAALVVTVLVLPSKLGWEKERQDKLARCIGLKPYHRERILVFLDGNRDPLDSGWTRAQSQIAVGSGRIFGKGYLQGTQNILGFLPRTVTPNDFIFSVIAEEKGFVGAAAVLLLFAGLIHFGIRTAFLAADRLGRLLCVGVVTLVFCHVFINVAMTIGIMPITGIPLPLISYGGTFMVGILTALGLLQSVHIRGDWR